MGDNMCDKVTCIDGIIIVNKKIGLPKWYNPGINKIALEAFHNMRECAKEEKVNLEIISGFRSYEYQKKIYQEYVNKFGMEKTDTFSAKPGHSEHQTGLAFDICDDSDNFIGTKEDLWLKNNAYKFGFIIRYPKGKEYITGYKYEPWHVRYVGCFVAKRIFERNITLEEYFNLQNF